MILEDMRVDIWNAQSRLEDAVEDLERAEQKISKAIDAERVVVLPCSFGDRLWFCYDDDDNGGLPNIEQSDPIKGFLVEPGGKISATTDFICYDEIGGPDLFLLESEAQAEAARRIKKMQDKEDK